MPNTEHEKKWHADDKPTPCEVDAVAGTMTGHGLGIFAARTGPSRRMRGAFLRALGQSPQVFRHNARTAANVA
jgi:hypothetical protein